MPAGPPVSREQLLFDAATIALVQAMACILVRHAGFDHVSDDDFARVTIAELFAHRPRLDPSGTSWLPFPFWTLGAALAVFGRSLGVAHVASIAMASIAAPLPYVALRLTGRSRLASGLAFALFAASPWSLWLGASTTPELVTASFTAAAVIALAAPKPRQWFVLGLVAACLSRYEPWPIAAVVALALLARHDRRLVFAAIVAAAAPLAWMAWNAHAHDGPLHFFRRVSSFKRNFGEGSTDTVAALLLYPKLIVSTRPDLALATVLACFFGDRRRWEVGLLSVAALVLFLAIGNARDGAPAHHPERALLPAFALLAAFAADVFVSSATKRRTLVLFVIMSGGAWLFTMRPLLLPPPGSSTAEDRTDAVARGLALRNAAHLTVTPCGAGHYEHYALIAAYGAPENVTLEAAEAAPNCPTVSEH